MAGERVEYRAEVDDERTYPCTTWDWMDRTRACVGGLAGLSFLVVVSIVVDVVIVAFVVGELIGLSVQGV